MRRIILWIAVGLAAITTGIGLYAAALQTSPATVVTSNPTPSTAEQATSTTTGTPAAPGYPATPSDAGESSPAPSRHDDGGHGDDLDREGDDSHGE